MSPVGIRRPARAVATVVLLAAAAAASLAVTSPAATVSGDAATLTAPDARVPAGEVLVLRGHGFPQDAHVALRAGRAGEKTVRIGGAHTGRRGSFVAEVRVELDAPAGRYVAVACHDRCRIKAAVHFRVQRP